MDLPEYFVKSALDNLYVHFMDFSRQELISQAENADFSLGERAAAGFALGMMQDSRINIFEPDMITIPHYPAEIGIPLEQVDIVLAENEGIGLKKEWLLKEVPKFRVDIPDFRIGKYLITNMEYKLFLEETHYTHIPSSWQFGVYPFYKSNHPVYTVSPQDAEAYAQWLSKKTGRHFRLPNEFEWEYAASGKEHLQFPWGDNFQSDCANTLESHVLQTTPVGIFPKGFSPFGCADMAGNVEEFVSDNYFIYPNGIAIVDDLGGAADYRIARGGSFSRHKDLARCSRRHGFYNKEIYVMGFRLAETI